jgi:manganese/zinc/iron transport system substrate-binding protein
MNLSPKYVLILFVGLLTLACTKESSKNSRLNIVCTTGMIADGIKNIVGEKADVTALMRAGVDPHLYKATQGDIQKLSNADIIVYNGLHLEGKMAEVLHKLAKKKTVIAVADGLSDTELRKLNATIFDPHIWFSVLHWQKAMAFAAKQIALKDTLNADEYTLNANKYSNTLIELNRWVLQEIESLPENQKIMITAHDAFGYFGEAYHIKVRGLQGISTITEFGLKDITDLVNYIVENRVKAVFVESSVPTRAIDAVVEGCAAKGHQIKIGGTLYSDAMGAEGTPEGTYVGMVKSNVSKIVKGLK